MKKLFTLFAFTVLSTFAFADLDIKDCAGKYIVTTHTTTIPGVASDMNILASINKKGQGKMKFLAQPEEEIPCSIEILDKHEGIVKLITRLPPPFRNIIGVVSLAKGKDSVEKVYIDTLHQGETSISITMEKRKI